MPYPNMDRLYWAIRKAGELEPMVESIEISTVSLTALTLERGFTPSVVFGTDLSSNGLLGGSNIVITGNSAFIHHVCTHNGDNLPEILCSYDPADPNAAVEHSNCPQCGGFNLPLI